MAMFFQTLAKQCHGAYFVSGFMSFRPNSEEIDISTLQSKIQFHEVFYVNPDAPNSFLIETTRHEDIDWVLTRLIREEGIALLSDCRGDCANELSDLVDNVNSALSDVSDHDLIQSGLDGGMSSWNFHVSVLAKMLELVRIVVVTGADGLVIDVYCSTESDLQIVEAAVKVLDEKLNDCAFVQLNAGSLKWSEEFMSYRISD